MSYTTSSALREQGLKDERNKKFMAMGYPPGPPKSVAKSLNLRDINTYMKLHEEFGDIFMLPLGDVPLVVTRSPEHIRELLGGSATELFPRPANVIANIQLLFGRAQIALDGEEHQSNKRMLSQWLFSAKENAKMAKPFRTIIEQFMSRLEEDMEKKQVVEAYYIAELAAADVSAAISMGRTYNALKLGHCPQLEALKRCDRIFLNRAMNKNWRQVENKETTEIFESSKKLIADTFTEAFAAIKMDPKKFDHNILEHMIEQNLFNRSAQCPMGKNPTELEAVSNMVGFLAGVGNTARMNTIGIELLAQKADVQKKVLEELHWVLGRDVYNNKKEAIAAASKGLAVPGSIDSSLFNYSKVMNLQYLRCFMHECLRLYTPSTSVAPRSCSQDSPLGNYIIPKGTNVMCNIYGSHRHPDYWSDAETFDPMRFNEDYDPNDSEKDVHLKSLIPEGFFPFGYGGHGCIGKNLAQEVTLMIWAMLIGNYELRKAPGKENAHFNTLHSDQILGFIEPVNGCYITISKRKINPEANEKMLRILEKQKEQDIHDEDFVTDFGEIMTERLTSDKNRRIPLSEVQKHTTREDGVWFIIKGSVYDATKWLKDHPGGPDVLIKSAGKDVTRLFELTNHSSFAVKEAEKYKIGVLDAEPSSKL